MTIGVKYTQDELVSLIRAGNQKAFSYLYDNYSKALFGVIHTIVNDFSESEDVLQKTFLKIWDNFQSYDSNKGRLYTWMLNIARNAGALVERDGSESEAYLKLPEATIDSRVAEMVETQVGEVDFQLKLQAKRFWEFLADVQGIREGVRNGRHKAAE